MPRPKGALDQLRGQRDGAVRPVDKPAKPAVVVGSYARISDAYEGPETGVTDAGVSRQLKVSSTLAEARGWVIHRTYVDNHVSAFKAGVVRDAFEDLLNDLESGVINGIICYNLDRLTRQVSDLERTVAIYDAGRRTGRELYFATAEGDINLASDEGLTMARVMVAFANKASRDTARRVTLKQKADRDEGRVRFGQRPFGWQSIMVNGQREWRIDRREAKQIRMAAEAITEGRLSWSAIAREWNAAGVLSPRGNQWTPTTVKTTMRSPRLAGWLMHKGRIATHSETGLLVRAAMPPILTDEQFEAFLVADAKIREGAPSNHHDGRRRYLLSGIARCAECGARLMGGAVKRNGKSYPQYRCTVSNRGTAGAGGCGKVSISAPGLDGLVEKLIVPIVVAHSGGVVTSAEMPWVAEIEALEAERKELMDQYMGDDAPATFVLPKATAVLNEIDRLRRLQAQWRQEVRVHARDESVTEESWPTLSLEERTRHVSRHIEAIFVSAAVARRGNSFDPGRVSPPVWRTQVGTGE